MTEFRYCPSCGAPVSLRVPEGDDRERLVCNACGVVHYRNPIVVAGSIPEAGDGRLLLCRRAIEPRAGFWTMPSGFLENGESVTEAALRETMEEACARVELLELSSVISVIRARQVHMHWRARLLDDGFAAGPESAEVRLFGEDGIPWDELAFASVHIALERYLDDRRQGRFRVHQVKIPRNRAPVTEPGMWQNDIHGQGDTP